MGASSFYSTLSSTAQAEDYNAIFGKSRTADGDLRSLSGEAGEIVKWCRYRLGQPIMTVELTNDQIFACFEQANIEYSRMVNTNQVQMWFLSILGAKRTGNFTGNSTSFNMRFLKQMTSYYSQEAKPIVGGNRSIKKAYVNTEAGKNIYNILTQGIDQASGSAMSDVIGSVSGHGDKIKITEVYHYPGSTVNKYWDVYSISNDFFPGRALQQNFRYRLRPVWETILNRQMLQQHTVTRYSNFNYNVVGDLMKISPMPEVGGKIWFDYIQYDGIMLTNDDIYTSGKDHDITSLWDRPYTNLPYRVLNSSGKRWTRQYCLALCRQTLGLVRRKFSTVQIPNSTVTLDGGRLVQQAIRLKQSLKDELYRDLQKIRLENATAADRKVSLNINAILKDIPVPIVVG